MSSLKQGEIMKGTVTDVKPYGVFVSMDDAGGINGLLHISAISAGPPKSLSEMFKKDDKIKVMIIGVNPDQNKLALSTKALESTPGEMMKDPQAVYANAENMAKKYQERLEEQEKTLAENQNAAEAPSGEDE